MRHLLFRTIIKVLQNIALLVWSVNLIFHFKQMWFTDIWLSCCQVNLKVCFLCVVV